MRTYFDNHVFTDELETKLLRLIDKPECLPTFTVLYGESGIGKTTFAKWFAKENATYSRYFPINESGLDKKVWADIESTFRNARLPLQDEEERTISKLVIIDEFHNAPKNAQDRFKTLYDSLDSSPDNDERVIFIMNTDSRVANKQIHDLLSPAMYSRVYRLSFDVPERLVNEVLEKSKRLYPDLSESEIRATLPDHRQLAQKQSLAEWAA
jgi:replication-associated recombination protein RarA